MTYTTGKSPPVGTTFASPVHFILQPLKQHSKQIYRKLKTSKNKNKKQKNLNTFNMHFSLVTLNILLRIKHAKKDGLL